MGSAERRNAIVKVLCRRRYDKIGNLAMEFGVSERTIRRDIEILSLTEPIYTQTGRHHGGVYVVDGYYAGQLYLAEDEILLLHQLYNMAEKQIRCVLDTEKKRLLHHMIVTYSKPKITER